MVAITVAYLGNLHCEAIHGPSGTGLTTDAPLDNGGRAESFSPTDLVATALGTCMLTVMGLKANALGVVIDGARVDIEKEMATAPRMIGRLRAKVQVSHDLPGPVRKQLEQAALTCPVFQSLSDKIDKQIEFAWS